MPQLQANKIKKKYKNLKQNINENIRQQHDDVVFMKQVPLHLQDRLTNLLKTVTSFS